MKAPIYISFFILALIGCTEELPSKLEFDADAFATFPLNSKFGSDIQDKDSSCIEVITHEQLRAQEEITIKLGDHCDSVEISIPAGGTITSASLYTDTLLKDPIASSPSFGMMDLVNHFTVSSKLRGRYFLYYGSCHWGSRMWVNFE